MARRHWTVVLVSDDETAVRQFRLSRDVARALIGVALLVMAGLATAGMRLADDGVLAIRATMAARKSTLLEAEVEDLQTRLDTLRFSLETLAAKDDYYRLLAGLMPLDGDVRQVGIGGPGMETLYGHPLYDLDRGIARKLFATSTDLNALLRRARLLSFSWREAEDTLVYKHERLASTPSISPARGILSSAFSYRRFHPLLGHPRPHLGVDIVADPGTPIVASANGTVRFAGTQGEYGLAIEVDHGYGVVTRYAHASRLIARRGQPVERGDVIALVGSTGLSVGPHLHYEVMVNGRHVDPRRYILDASVIRD
jgi:murein DD-endopeptidase MepM/ murein hydrolase activator NlpD